MRRLVLGLVILVALSVCCLIPGTPVNNDPSDAARTAGIHLATHAPARAAVEAAAPLLAALVVAMAFVVLRRASSVLPRTGRVLPALRSIDLVLVGRRRGPPALAI